MNDVWSRRKMIKVLGASGAAVALGACEPVKSAGERSSNPLEGAMKKPTKTERMPTVFLPHGGGPWPFMDDSLFGTKESWAHMRTYMEELSMVTPETPRAILLVSAHWEAERPTLQTSPNPPMYYDYGGFPKHTYELEWPAPGAPELADSIRTRLENAGFQTSGDPERGFDHGVFVPMMLAYEEATIPTLQLSLKRGLDPAEHIAIGRALEGLRDEGVFIVGSGMSYHNLRALGGSMRGNVDPSVVRNDSKAFDDWLAETIDLGGSALETRLVEWERAPAARASHPREEHLLPLMVVAGAAGKDAGALPYRDVVMNAHVSAVHFG